MIDPCTKFEVATTNGLGDDALTKNVTARRTDGRTDGETDRRTDFSTRLIYSENSLYSDIIYNSKIHSLQRQLYLHRCTSFT